MKIDSRAPLASSDAASEVRTRPSELFPVSPTPPPAVRQPSLPRTPPLPSVQDDLQALELAAGVEPGLFAGSRPAEILEDILERILPTLPLDGETRTLAMALVREELDTRQALDRQRVETETGGMMQRDDHDAAKLLQGLGDLYLRVGQGQRALVLLLLAVQLNPDDQVLLARLAAAFTAIGDGERALRTLDRLHALQGESAAWLLLRSRALWNCGQYTDARACFARYRQLRQERDA